jgi:hypothetical protein
VISYEVYWRDPIKGYQLIGVLPERRRSPKRITNESVINWGIKYLGYNLYPYEILFVEVKINGEVIRPL